MRSAVSKLVSRFSVDLLLTVYWCFTVCIFACVEVPWSIVSIIRDMFSRCLFFILNACGSFCTVQKMLSDSSDWSEQRREREIVSVHEGGGVEDKNSPLLQLCLMLHGDCTAPAASRHSARQPIRCNICPFTWSNTFSMVRGSFVNVHIGSLWKDHLWLSDIIAWFLLPNTCCRGETMRGCFIGSVSCLDDSSM